MGLSLFGHIARAAAAPVGVFSGPGAARDPQGIMSGVYPVGRGEPPDLSTRSLLEAYETMPWVRAIAGRIATGIAETQWTLSAQTNNDGKAVRNKQVQRAAITNRRAMLKELRGAGRLRPVDDHMMLDALHSANPMMTGFDVMLLAQLGLDLVGDAFLMKERNGLGRPVGFWPVPSHWVIGLPTPKLPYFFVSYNAWQGEIPDREFLWLHDPTPANPYGRGAGTARALGDELETDEYSAKHAKQLFFNRARPDFMVMADGMQATELRRLEQNWMNRLQGFWRVAKPYFTNRKLEIKEFQSPNLENLTLVPLRQFERDIIMQTWGFPPEILGILENSNRATIDAADYFLEKHVIQPRRERLRFALQVRLAPEYDDRLIVDYVSTVDEDRQHELEVLSKAPHVATTDEWRQKAGLPAEGGKLGKSRLVPLNSYVTTDPLDLSTRPLPTGGTDAEPAGKPPTDSKPPAAPKPAPKEKP